MPEVLGAVTTAAKRWNFAPADSNPDLCSAIAAPGSLRFRSGLTRRRGRAAERVKKTLANAREREAYNCSSKLIENESVTARGHSRTQYAREKRDVFIIFQVRTFANPYAHEKRNI